MNWFTNVFPDLVSAADGLAAAWRLLAILLLGAAVGAILLGLRRALPRFATALAVLAAWELLLPERPLDIFPGQLAELQDEVLLVGLLGCLGILGALRGILRPSLPVITTAAACLVSAGLAWGHHMLLLNGVDTAYRQIDGQHLVALLQTSPQTRMELCTATTLTCGTGLPDTRNAQFDKDIRDWMTHALPDGRDGTLSASSGTAGSSGFVWAATRRAGEITWIMQPYADKTAAFAAAYFALQLAVLIFWGAGAILVEALHLRARNRARPQAG